jgi:hypothetical protein
LSGVTFPLIPRRRVLGLPFGGLHSARRGIGSDVAGSRPYRPGDDIKRIDWNASARLSLARDSDEFIIREHYAEEAPRVVVLADRRPSMGVFSDEWPWLDKPQALAQCVRLISDSALAARGLLGYLDHAEGDGAFWRPPRSERAPRSRPRVPRSARHAHEWALVPDRATARSAGRDVRVRRLGLPRAPDARRVDARARTSVGDCPGRRP